jgi:hypothetical protein
METSSSLYTFLPLFSTIAYLAKEPNFSLLNALPLLLPLLIPILAHIPSWDSVLRQMKQFFYKRGVLEFVARQQIRRWNEDPNSLLRKFTIVMWDWNKRSELIGCTRIIEEANAPGSYQDNDDGEEVYIRASPLFVDDETNEFYNKTNPNIRYKMWIERSIDNQGTNTSEIILLMSFQGSMLPNNMVEHIEWIKNRANEILLSKQTKQRVLVTTDMNMETDLTTPTFMTYDFNTTSGFNNFFAEESTLIHKDILHFLQNKSMYERTGRPWTYTVLNEGPPGVGKTKLVKAIAAETGYTLIVINLQHIPNMRTLYEAFHSSVLAGETIPHTKRLYYIPEVDTQVCEVLKNRSSRKRADKKRTNSTEITESPLKTSLIKQEIKPTLGEILNVLDGVPERSGHILIMDTNHIEDLDLALIRPGRVDRIVRWKKLSSANCKAYLENYYGAKLGKSVVLPERKWSAAELGGLIAGKTLEESLHALKN